MIVTFGVNGSPAVVSVAGWESLLSVLRDRLGLTGTKGACEQGECGSCVVLLDGALVCSCLVMIGSCDGATVETVEGLAMSGRLKAVTEALLESGAVQCGFCTPGFAVALASLLDGPETLAVDDVRDRLSGHLCRCTGYGAIVRAIESLIGRHGR